MQRSNSSSGVGLLQFSAPLFARTPSKHMGILIHTIGGSWWFKWTYSLVSIRASAEVQATHRRDLGSVGVVFMATVNGRSPCVPPATLRLQSAYNRDPSIIECGFLTALHGQGPTRTSCRYLNRKHPTGCNTSVSPVLHPSDPSTWLGLYNRR